MHLSLRPLFLGTAALLLTAASASAQLVELVTEAPVTFQLTLTTTTTTETETERRTTSTITRFTQLQIIEELIASGDIPAESPAGWSLLAVRAAPADLYYVEGTFHLYAVSADTEPVAIPKTKFEAIAKSKRRLVPFGPDITHRHLGLIPFNASVAKYTERHLGQYVLGSKGTVTSHTSYFYRPTLNVGTSRFALTESYSDGFASIAYQTKDLADGWEVFFYAISSLRGTVRGGFTGTVDFEDGSSLPAEGLVTLTVAVGAAKLVRADRYPGLNYFTSEFSTE